MSKYYDGLEDERVEAQVEIRRLKLELEQVKSGIRSLKDDPTKSALDLPPLPEPLLTLEEVADLTHTSVRWVVIQIKKGNLPAVRLSRKVTRCYRADVIRWLERSQEQSQPARGVAQVARWKKQESSL
jgi:excisionase family DNA binding protein